MFPLAEIALATALALYPEVRWDYTMNVLPEGWTEDIWQFGGIYGAYIHFASTGPDTTITGNLLSGSDSVLIPPNCDSIILHVDHQTLSLNKTGSASSAVYVYYRYYSDWDEAWHFYWNMGSPPEMLDLSIPVQHWEHLSIHFMGRVNVYGPYSSASLFWGLEDLTLTLWCDGTPIVRRTWGSLKREFFSNRERL